jgi:hypothetical protein
MGYHGTVAAEDMKDISTVLSSIDEESRFDKNPYNDESEEVDVNGKKGSSEKSDRDGEYVGLVKATGEVNEESVQTTAPDGKVFDDGAVNEKWRMDLFPQINPRRSEHRQVLYGFSRYSGGGGYEGYKHGFVFNCGGVPVWIKMHISYPPVKRCVMTHANHPIGQKKPIE